MSYLSNEARTDRRGGKLCALFATNFEICGEIRTPDMLACFALALLAMLGMSDMLALLACYAMLGMSDMLALLACYAMLGMG